LWQEKTTALNLLTPLAEDSNNLPASQAYKKRIFSICGMFLQRLPIAEHYMQKSLEIASR